MTFPWFRDQPPAADPGFRPCWKRGGAGAGGGGASHQQPAGRGNIGPLPIAAGRGPATESRYALQWSWHPVRCPDPLCFCLPHLAWAEIARCAFRRGRLQPPCQSVCMFTIMIAGEHREPAGHASIVTRADILEPLALTRSSEALLRPALRQNVIAGLSPPTRFLPLPR